MSKAIVSRIQIPVPTLAEQRRIADVLDRVEELRVKRSTALAQLETLAQSVFLDHFGDPLNSKEDGCHIQFGTATTRITYGFTSPMTHLESGIPIVTAKNVRNG